MIRGASLSMLVSLLLVTPVVAQDTRLVSRLYNSDEVVRIEGRVGVQASIAFDEDEHIENVAIGDSNSWQVTPNKRANMLFVKPLASRARTNLTVVTDKRSYFFDLVASATARPLYVLRFKYPDGAKPNSMLAATPPSRSRAQIVTPERAVDPATLNFAWVSKGKRNLLPSRIYDDGVSTFVTWPEGAPLPAFLTRNARGEEGPVNFAVRDDVIVIDGVPGVLVLRSGKDMATLENKRARGPANSTKAAIAVAARNQRH